MASQASPLPKGYKLDRYRVDRVLGSGGFACVYLATDRTTGEQVAIKEYYPAKLARRNEDYSVCPNSEKTATLYNLGYKRFFEEGMTLAQLKHPNIINIRNFFPENNTAYLTMDYNQGYDLRWFIKNSTKGLDEEFLMRLFPKVLNGLRALHESGILHLDIKPSNILMTATGEPLLIDFGAVHKLTASTSFQSVQVLTHGYSPPELYNKGELGTWSDIYAVGMTMRECLLGKRENKRKRSTEPVELTPLLRMVDQKHNYTMLEVIDRCTSHDVTQRPQTVDKLLDELRFDPALGELVDLALTGPQGKPKTVQRPENSPSIIEKSLASAKQWNTPKWTQQQDATSELITVAG